MGWRTALDPSLREVDLLALVPRTILTVDFFPSGNIEIVIILDN